MKRIRNSLKYLSGVKINEKNSVGLDLRVSQFSWVYWSSLKFFLMKFEGVKSENGKA